MRYDVSNVDSRPAEPPPPGIYPAKVIQITDEQPEGKSRRWAVIIEITENVKGKGKGYRVYDYIVLDSEAAAWKVRQFVDALALPAKGTINTDRPQDLSPVRIQLKHDTYQEQVRGKVQAYLVGELPDEEEDEDEDEDVEEEEVEDAEEDEDEDEEEEAESEYASWTLKQLRAELQEARPLHQGHPAGPHRPPRRK